MKKTILILLFLGFFFCHPVYADSWTDEGNYNPDWESKCSGICAFDDEKDVAGVFKTLLDDSNRSFGREVTFTKKDLDFSIRDIPLSVLSRFNMRIDTRLESLKIKYNQRFRMSGYKENDIIYVYQTFMDDEYSHGTITILENPTGLRGDKVKVQLTPDYGYTANLKYRRSSEINASVFDATPLGNNIYEIEYPSEVNNNYDIYLDARFTPVKFDIVQNLDLGVTCSNCMSGKYGETKSIVYNVSPDFEIVSATLNGTSIEINDNTLEFVVGETNVVEIHTQKRVRDSIDRTGEFKFKLRVDKFDPNHEFLPGVVFQLKNLDGNYKLSSNPKNSLEENYYFLSNGIEIDAYQLKRTSGNSNVTSDFLEVYQLFSSDYKQVLESIQTYGDLEKIQDDVVWGNGAYLSKTGNYSIDGQAYIPMILEEAVVPDGFSKKKFIVYLPLELNLEFYVDPNQEVSSNSPLVSVYLRCSMGDYSFASYDRKKTYKSIYPRVGSDAFFSCSSGPFKALGDSFGAGHKPCAFEVVNEYGVPALSIKNYVNQKDSVVVSKNDLLEYQIIVENTGNITSTNNVITTKLPKEVEYVEDSANHKGVYHSDTHSISWILDVLEEGDNKIYTYQGRIKEGAKPGVSFIGTSEVQSNEVDVVQSGETQVQIQLLNPGTFRNVFSIFLLIFTVGMTSFTYYKKRSA